MQGRRDWRAVLAGVLEWPQADKAMLLVALLVPLFLQYLSWSVYVLARDDRALLVDSVFLLSQRPLFWWFLGGALGLLASGLVLRRGGGELRWFTHLCVHFYSLTLVYCGYIIGSFHFVSGVVLTGAPMVGLILFDRGIIYPAWGVALLAVIGSGYAGASGLLPYAPALVPPVPGDPTNQLFWTTTTIFFAAPHLASLTMFADMLIARWREREEAFRTLSLTDVLTGAHNRRSAMTQLEREVARMQRTGQPLSVVLVDLDHFKRINDTWGHPAGDRVLQATARTLAGCVRDYDVVGRWGGEEFLLVLPDAALHSARSLAERCRERLQALAVTADNGAPVPVSGSFGVACSTQLPGGDAGALVRAADEALYRAKQGGRNRVESAA